MSYGLLHGARRSVRKTKTPAPGLAAGGVADIDWEISRSTLTGLKEIGQGQFGVVFIGTATDVVPGEASSQVAIKTLSAEGAEARADFDAEAKIMKALSRCPKIVRLLGLCTKAAPLYMVMEYLSRGDLKDVLVDAKPKSGPSPLSFRRLALMGADVAEAMTFLVGLKIVHRDLAARNCLVSQTFEVKVGDFGLTRKTYAKEYYRMAASSPLPIKWMAPECLNDGVFSTASDIWAFGIVLYEVATFGRLPYPGLENMEVAELVMSEEYRMEEPRGCPQGFYGVMTACWEEEPEDRGSFEDKQAALVGLAARLSDEPVTRETLRTGGGRGGGDDDEPDEPEPAASVTAYEEPLGSKGFSFSTLRAARGGAEFDAYERPVARSDPAAVNAHQAAVADWISGKVGRPVDAAKLHEELRDGVVLCQLMQKMAPGIKIEFAVVAKTMMKAMDNISAFLCAASDFGLKTGELFECDDLFDDEDMPRVVMSLIALKDAAASQ